MYVSHLSLVDYRSYEHVDIEFAPGVNVLVGHNGQGKTNIVEAIGYLATLASHRVAHDTALIRVGAQRALIRSRVVRGDRAQVVELELLHGKANKARVNRGQPGRASTVLGIVKTVVFAPEDLVLVKGDPDARRRYLDDLTVLMIPRMRSVLADYDKVVRQRSALLKQLMRGGASHASDATLAVWDERMVALGSQIIGVRQRLVAALAPHLASGYETVSSGQSEAKMRYRPSLESFLDEPMPAVMSVEEISVIYAEVLARARRRELERGVCIVGPHRDDVEQTLNNLPVKGYASHGESWSYALAMRLASYRLMTEGPDENDPASADLQDMWWTDSQEDTEPILILDDVFAELDVRRRRQLADIAAQARQVIITAAVAQDVPDQLRGRTLSVTLGAVTDMDGAEDQLSVSGERDGDL